MPSMPREEWVKLSPDEKVVHRVRRVIDRIDASQKRYNRDRASGKITNPIAFFEE